MNQDLTQSEQTEKPHCLDKLNNDDQLDCIIPCGEHYETSPKKTTMEVFDEISLDWKIQIYNKLVRSFGGRPMTPFNSTLGITTLPKIAVEEFVKVVTEEHNNDPRQTADVLKLSITEHVSMMSAMAMHETMKNKELMESTTNVVDSMVEKVNSEQPVKRKKSKAKSNHLPNMKNRSVKSTLGASILGMLGKVQRDTQDAHKKALLKELPMADVIEMSTGEKLPDYQANLINQMHLKADPDSRIAERLKEDQDNTGLSGESFTDRNQGIGRYYSEGYKVLIVDNL